MNKKEIQTLLHHREPYLLIDSIESMTDIKIVAKKKLNIDEYFFKGHFPGAPILPGAMMQEMTTQTAGVLLTKNYSPLKNYNSNTTKGYALGVLKKVTESRYKGFARPSDELTIEVSLIESVENLFEFKGKIYKNNEVIMRNLFQLMNISEDHLL
jgi:3-hydroxyacyl-[acyl-carrier-protein] dehydratase